MVDHKTLMSKYLDTLLLYYEEEIMGEAYFCGLADHFDGPGEREKLTLLAEVERHAAAALRPLLQKHGLVPRTDEELKQTEWESIEQHGAWSWAELMKYMSVRYPLYMDDFEELEKMAPEEDLPPLKFLTAHEVAAIEFAQKEVAGESDSVEPLRRYLDSPPPSAGRNG